MDFAFKSMQQLNVGMVHGIEVVSWVENPQCQTASKLLQKFEPCITPAASKPNKTNANEETANETSALCETSPVSVEMKKFNRIANAEFIANLNAVLRTQLNSLYNMQQCHGILYSFDDTKVDKVLLNHHDTMNTMRISELKGNITMDTIENKREGIQSYVDNFYSKCLTALSSNIGGLLGGAVLANAWYSIPDCHKISCTLGNAVWLKNECKCILKKADVDLLVEMYCMPTLADLQ